MNLYHPGKRILILLVMVLPLASKAQFPGSLKDGLKTYLTPDSSAFIKLNFVSQIWTRFTDNNPGTTIDGQLQSETFDVGVRRIRFVLSGQLTDRISFFVQFGQNNLSYTAPRKSGSFFHDVTGEYAFIKKKFSLGFGLHGWNGPGRFSNSSVSSIMMLDPPIYQEVTNDVNDQFVRKLGVYAKGKLGKLDYRVALSKPFDVQTASSPPDPLGPNSSFSKMPSAVNYQGYFMYQFLDQEGNSGPGTTGTYLGKKTVFNIGAGFMNQSKAMWSSTPANDTLYHALNLWAVDVYYDAPLNKEKGTAISLYTGYFKYDYGNGYIRNVGPMNPTNGVKNGSFNGTGNNAPIIGNGDIFYLQAGYKLRDNLLGSMGTLMFYSSVEYGKFDRLNDAMVITESGVNWLIHGHNSKFTLNYQSRPIFSSSDIKSVSRKGEWVLQYQIAF